MMPFGGDFVESGHKRPVEHSGSTSSDVTESDQFCNTTTTATSGTDTDNALGLQSQKKRARLQYRDHVDSFQSEDSWRTESTATSALTGVVDPRSGQWVLRRNRSSVSVSSTRTEGSDHEEATTAHSNRSPSISSPASTPFSSRPVSLIFDGESSSQQQQPQQHYQGDGDGLQQEMESLTSRVENWSLTNLRALRRNNVFEDSSVAATQRQQVRVAKRDVMRVLRRSNASASGSFNQT
jgi:hypothetical protein